MAEEEFQSSELAELGVETSQSKHMEMAVEDRREHSYLTFPKNTELDVKECAKNQFYRHDSESLYRYISSFPFSIPYVVTFLPIISIYNH